MSGRITLPRVLFVIAAAAAIVIGVAACATSADPGGAPPSGIVAKGDVLGQGTVLQVGNAAPQFCLGGVMESFPPQCSGPEIVGWNWDEVAGAESANDVTWGAYALQGTWDGLTFTLTHPAMLLALYDPLPFVDAYLDPANAGNTPELDLLAIQLELNSLADVPFLSIVPQNGYLFGTVIYDDGDIQAYVDQQYGKEVVQIRSALRPVDG